MLGSPCLFNFWVSVRTVYDSVYCRVSDHWLYATFSNALWDTLSWLYSEYICSLRIRTVLQNDVDPIE